MATPTPMKCACRRRMKIVSEFNPPDRIGIYSASVHWSSTDASGKQCPPKVISSSAARLGKFRTCLAAGHGAIVPHRGCDFTAMATERNAQASFLVIGGKSEIFRWQL